MDERLGLYPHNKESYKRIKEAFETDNYVAIIHTTGSGKSYNALQWILDNKDKNVVFIVPTRSIMEHIKEIIDRNSKLDFNKDFKNVSFFTYQGLIHLDDNKIKNMNMDMLILDEFHHIGAPIWGSRVNYLIETHPKAKVLGMTAFSIRNKGTNLERNMVNPETEELFSDKVASIYTLADAIRDGVLPKPVYKSAYVHLDKSIEELEKKLKKVDNKSSLYKTTSKLIDELKKKIINAPGMGDVFKQNIKRNGKYIYFCSQYNSQNSMTILEIKEETKKWLYEMGLKDDDFVFYTTTADMGKDGELNRKSFYSDTDLKGNDTSNKLRIMFAINQYNEGVHVPGVDGVIMGRATESDIIYYEQLGRALSSKDNLQSDYKKYVNLSLEDLIELCKSKDIKVTGKESKEYLIERLVSPVVIDLANNLDYIIELEQGLKTSISYGTFTSTGSISVGESPDGYKFDIDVLNRDIFELLKYISDSLVSTWEDMFELAKEYYNHNHNLDIVTTFKTFDGFTYDENGYELGKWISNQRAARRNNNLSKNKIDLLDSLGMIWNKASKPLLRWDGYYELCKKYKQEKGDLYIPYDFRTFDGYTYAIKGHKLGEWFRKQKNNYENYINPEDIDKIHKLEELDIDWSSYRQRLADDAFARKLQYFKDFYSLEDFEKYEQTGVLNGEEVTEKQILADMIYKKYIEGPEMAASLNLVPDQESKNNDDELTSENIEDVIIDKDFLELCLSHLTPKFKDILVKKYGLDGNDPMTYEELGKEYGVTRERARQLEAKALRDIKNTKAYKEVEKIYRLKYMKLQESTICFYIKEIIISYKLKQDDFDRYLIPLSDNYQISKDSVYNIIIDNIKESSIDEERFIFKEYLRGEAKDELAYKIMKELEDYSKNKKNRLA